MCVWRFTTLTLISKDEFCRTDNFHIDICSVLPSRVSNHNRVDPLVLPLSALDGEDTVSFGSFHVNPPVCLRDHLNIE